MSLNSPAANDKDKARSKANDANDASSSKTPRPSLFGSGRPSRRPFQLSLLSNETGDVLWLSPRGPVAGSARRTRSCSNRGWSKPRDRIFEHRTWRDVNSVDLKDRISR